MIRDIVELADDRASAEAYMRAANRTWSVFLGVGDFSTNEMDIVGYVAAYCTSIPRIRRRSHARCSCSYQGPYCAPCRASHHRPYRLCSSLTSRARAPSSRHRYRHDDLHVYTPETMPAITLQPEFENLVYVDKHPQVGREGPCNSPTKSYSACAPATRPHHSVINHLARIYAGALYKSLARDVRTCELVYHNSPS